MAEDEQPTSPLVKTAIFTRIYGRPTIPHILKFVSPQEAAAPRRFGGAEERPKVAGQVAQPAGKSSSMPIMRQASASNIAAVSTAAPAASAPNAATSPTVAGAPTVAAAPSAAPTAPEALPAPTYSDPSLSASPLEPCELGMQDPLLGPRTFSYHNPWWFGTSAGAYSPADYAAYRANYYRYFPYYGYYGFQLWPFGVGRFGWGGAYGGYPFGSAYGGLPYAGYGSVASPYNYTAPYGFASPYYGYGGYGLGAGFGGLGIGGLGFGGLGPGGVGFGGYGPGAFAAPSYAGCYYW